MLVNILILAIAAIFSAYVIYSACRKYIGLNPKAPSLWARIKAWWPGFVKRHIVDDDPYQSELHAATRYAEAQGHWHNLPAGSTTGSPSSPVDGVTGLPRNTCPHCGATPYIMETAATWPYHSSDIAVCANCKRPK